MELIGKIRNKLSCTVTTPLYYTEDLQKSYNTSSVAGGSLKGKYAVVTGATSGIGLAIAKRFVVEGCYVIITGRNPQKLAMAKDEIKRQYDVGVETVEMDNLNIADIESKVSFLFSSHCVDIWVNNAGIFKKKDQQKVFRDYPEQDFHDMLNTNFKSTYLLNQLVADKMIENGTQGNILNIASICGITPSFGYTPYGMSKVSTIILTEMMQEKYGDKIFFHAISPGSICTRMNNNKMGDNISRNNNGIDTRHTTMPEEVASLAALMCSDLGKYMKGENLQACASERFL